MIIDGCSGPDRPPPEKRESTDPPIPLWKRVLIFFFFVPVVYGVLVYGVVYGVFGVLDSFGVLNL